MSNRNSSKLSAFTLIEMLVVTGMLGILMGVAVTGLGQAKKQARVAKANVELRELVNAWLSYESAYDDWPVSVQGDELEATEDNLQELLGGGGRDMVFLNAPIVSGAFRDPWGTPYKFRLLQNSGGGRVSDEFSMSIAFPNRHRYLR
ncbi:MAG: prepilin-type N-terminal cleavage/methylation domain-containing protein [Kiritimatiellae bacterium]|nr:prepilin-type N-terminal cleavage/methylation domain-containing protein [Kiritimatiellia bacterium]